MWNDRDHETHSSVRFEHWTNAFEYQMELEINTEHWTKPPQCENNIEAKMAHNS